MSITLADIASNHKYLHVACGNCGRRGRYLVAGLISKHGLDQSLPDLALKLSSDCEIDPKSFKRCSVYFPKLNEDRAGK